MYIYVYVRREQVLLKFPAGNVTLTGVFINRWLPYLPLKLRTYSKEGRNES